MVDGISPASANGAALAPGVLYEHRWERDLTSAFHTGVPALIGYAQYRPNERADDGGVRILQRRDQFDQVFAPSTSGYLGHAVRGFFDNGGTQCVVVPVDIGAAGPNPAAAALAALLAAPLRSGGLMEDLDMIDLVCVPDLMLAAGDDEALLYEVQGAVLAHCRRMQNRFAILDTPRGGPRDGADGTAPDLRGAGSALRSEQARVLAALRQWDALGSGDGALYFPWLRIAHGRGRPHAGMVGNMVAVPPCGHVAGVYARTDELAGPHRAPANQPVYQTLGLDVDLGDADYATLNDNGVNCLRSLPGRGLRVWGARTLSREPGWRYVNVRRIYLTLMRWVEGDSGDLVFEPNDARLWDHLAQRLRSYCRTLLEHGALAGNSQAEAFHVKCDAETNPPESIEAGVVVAEVGLALVAPAEFIVVRITRHFGGAFSAAAPVIA